MAKIVSKSVPPFEGYTSDSYANSIFTAPIGEKYIESPKRNDDGYDGDEASIWVPKAASSSTSYDDDSYVVPIEEDSDDDSKKPQVVSCAQYFATKFGCNLHTSKLSVPDSSYVKYDEIFPLDVLNAFTIEYIEPKLRDSTYGVRYNGACDKQDYAVMVKYLREHFPLFALTSFERHPDLVYVNHGTFVNHHELERRHFSESAIVRSVDKPEIINVYHSSHDESVYIWQCKQETRALTPEELLIDHMQTRAKWVSMPDAKLLEVSKFESQSAIKLLSHNRELLRNVSVIISLASTPSYIDAFTLYKNLHEIKIGRFHPHTFLFNHLQNLEKIYVYGQKNIEESLPFVFRLDNPVCCLTDISPETQDKILSHVTFGISDMIDYSCGAYLSGSMISAAIQIIRNGDHFLLESNYPRVHTELCYSPDIAGTEYETLRAYMYALTQRKASVTVSSKTEELVSFTFSCDPEDIVGEDNHPSENSEWYGTCDMILHDYRMIAKFNEDIITRAKELINNKTKVKFVFRVTAGCDIDVPVKCSDNPANVQMVAVDLLTKMAVKWPGAQLSVVTKNRKTPMYRISTTSVLERITGFRDVEIYPANEPRTQIASYHVNAVRAWKGPLHGIYATASAVMGHTNNETSHHHYFAGKEKPWRILDKYVSRGFGTFGMKAYNDLRKMVDCDNPLHDINQIKSTSSIGITGKYNLFAHIFNPFFTVKFEDGVIAKEMFNFGEIEKWETHRQRIKRLSQ